jgi:hypothetical protein
MRAESVNCVAKGREGEAKGTSGANGAYPLLRKLS